MKLIRFKSDHGYGVFGALVDDNLGGLLMALTLEHHDKLIPPGLYPLDPYHESPRFGDDCIAVNDVPGRTNILMHPANWASQLRGCIALGNSFGWLPRGRVGPAEFALKDSKSAVRRIRSSLKGDKNPMLRVYAAR